MNLLLALALARPRQDGQDLGRVQAFVTSAHIGLDPTVVLPPFADVKEVPQYAAFLTRDSDVRRGIRAYQYNGTTVYLDIVNGRIELYNDTSRNGVLRNSDGSLAPRKVSDAAAATLARRFYLASGWPGEIEPYEFEDGQGTNDRSVQVRYVPKAGGVSYDEDRWQGLMLVNRETGQLDGFYSPDRNMPAPPASLVPRLSPGAARLAALRMGVEFRGESLSESPRAPLRLRVWLPRTPLGSYPGERVATAGGLVDPAVGAALSARRGMLAYVGWLLGGSRRSGLRVAVDANTGRILGSEDPFPEGGAGGGGGGSPIGDLEVPAAPRPWRLAEGSKAWSPPATAALAPTPALPPTGRRLLLTDGKAAFPATYDAKTNLLGIGGKAYRPGPALATLLRRRNAK